MKPAPFAYHAPRTVEAAVALLAALAADDARVIAGGQSLVPMMAFRLTRPRHLIDINGIPGLDRLAISDGMLSIGATARHSAFEVPHPGDALGRLLADVARHVAHPPIRNRGTFCGSIAHSDPASEWCLVAATIDAEIVVRSARGLRVLRAASFFSGAMTNALAAEELLTEVRLPLLPERTRFGFDEVSRRAGDFALAAAVVLYRIDRGRIAEPRIGIGGAEAAPRRIAAAEAMLSGAAPTRTAFREAAAAAAAAIDPLVDGQSDETFRRDLVRAVTERALERSAA